MATKERNPDKKISEADVLIKARADAGADLGKAKRDDLFQKMISNIVSGEPTASTDIEVFPDDIIAGSEGQNPASRETRAQRQERIAFLRFMRTVIINGYDVTAGDVSINPPYLTYENLANKTQLTQAEVFFANTSDARVQRTPVGEYIGENGRRTYYIGEGLTKYLKEAQQNTTHPTPDQPDRFRLTSIGEVQREMHEAIQVAAKVTGVPAKLLGAMVGKESIFGRDQVSKSGAEGLFHQTDGYLKANYVNNLAQARQIAAVVPEAAKYLEDGKITLAEANKLSWNPLAAAVLTGLRAKAVAKDFGLDLRDERTWGYVYTDHNAGRGSLNKLVQGGMTDRWIQDLNPSMYKGVKSASDVLEVATRDMILWGNRYEKLTQNIDSSSAKPTAQKKVHYPAPEPA